MPGKSPCLPLAQVWLLIFIHHRPTGLPWWGFLVCLLIPIVFTVPIGIVQAITNIQLGLNLLTEYTVGYLVPGQPIAMMMFKNYGYICCSQALGFAQDMKLGHYMKVPPRTMFSAQLVASIWSAIVQIAVMNWALMNIPEVWYEIPPFRPRCCAKLKLITNVFQVPILNQISTHVQDRKSSTPQA